ncbi:MAG TPA: hypothetical protein VKX45_04410 [Bryobacteraceae bacterium]|nr:hypothetical protein [Bryobacteraceae bacterium]
MGIIGGNQAQQNVSRGQAATAPVKDQAITHASPAFEAWLQGYRQRLEQACERAALQAVSASDGGSQHEH